MFTHHKRLFYFIALFFLVAIKSNGQVTPNVNTGNPAFPFPQFLDYGSNRKSLASVNSPGVPHAEMEQRILDAWQMVCNDVSPYPSTVVGGVQYLYPTAPNHCTCVEGDGYYLMGAAVMADKTFFDGYYMWAHDRSFHGTQRFVDGVYNSPNYGYAKGLSGAGSLGAGTGVAGGGMNGNSATDGDVDVALALLMAYKQWGEHSGIFIPSMGNKELNYKEEALKYIRAMVDTAIFPLALPMIKYTSGDVGFDGYLKGGDSQGELTDWANAGYLGMQKEVGQQNYYYDYSAPAWFRQFRLLLEAENDIPFYINQYKRVEASCDWLMGLHYSKNVKNIPYLGKVSYGGTGPTDFSFSNYIPDGEDFRASWRTIMNYVWHDNPTFTWNPTTHQAIDGTPNTYERDMGIRYAKFLKEPQSAPWNNACRNIGDLKPKITFKGPYTLVNGYTPDGTASGGFPLNWIHGTGAASAIVGQNFELMGEMFRHCIIAWDGNGYLNSKPMYFHEWFKMLGLITLSGNFHAPTNMVAKPNLKVYHKIDKTYAFTGDQVTYTISYRNYGSVDAAGSVVKFGIPNGFSLVTTTKGSLVGDSIVWNVGAIKGMKTGGLTSTIDSMRITLKIGPTASGRYCTTARIFCTNGLGWTSNEYPNNKTAVMERNCIDVVKRALRITKTSDRTNYNPGQDVKYKIVFENSSDAGWINGGRQGVRVAFAHEALTTPTATAANVLKFRLFHDAEEAYINFANYRVSYFLNDPSLKCLTGTPGCTTGWIIGAPTIYEGGDKTQVKAFQETIVPGSDANGSWNQRIVLQFADQLATITQHLQQYTGSPGMVHEGGMASLRAVWRVENSNWANLDWTDDWSWDATKSDGDDGIYYPITDDYTDPNNLGVPINSWHKSACQTSTNVMKKVLVEEWDGFTWRRILGNGPSPGRDVEDVVVTDTLPVGVTFKNFIRQSPFGISATTSLVAGRTVIKWTIPKMQINMKDSLLFTATIDGTCPLADKQIINDAWIQGKTESAIFSPDTINVTCVPITVCPDPTTLTKSSDKATYTVGQTVKFALNYTQTIGSIANPNLNSATDWTAKVGAASNATFGTGKMTIGGINSGDFVLTHDYSYGTNTIGDGIEGTIQINAYSKAAIVVRQTGGTALANGVYIVIKPAYATEVEVFNGTTSLSKITIPYSTPSSLDFKIQLTGAKLELWIGPTPTSFSGAPAMTVTGIPIQAGWAGIARGNTFGDASSTASLTSWKTHLDAAFNVTITDPVPTGITTPSAITTSLGTGANVSNVITYNLVTGKTPMLYNATATLAWNGTFNTCKKITNVAYVNTMGLTTNQYGVCYDINCNSAPLCSAPTSVSLTANPTGALCSGNTVTLTAAALPAGTWTYAFKKATTVLQTSTTLLTYNANLSGNYVVTVYDTKDSATCNKTSATATVTINSLPTIVASSSPTVICTGATATISATGGTSYVWDNSIGTATSKAVSPIITTTYNVTGTDANNCSNTASVIVNVNALPSITATATPATICAGSSSSLTGNGGTSYVWSSPLGAGSPKSVSPTTTTTYSVTGTDANTCSNTATVTVTVSPSLNVAIAANDSSICNGTSATLTTSGATTYAWSNSLPAGSSNSVSPTTSTTYTVTGSTGVCTGVGSLLITVNTLPTIKVSALPTLVCSGNTTTLTASGGATYTWSNSLGNAITATATPTVNTTYTVTGTDVNGCVGTAGVAVSLSSQVLPTVATNPTITIGSAVPTLTASGTLLKWYDATKTTSLFTGASFTPTISTNGNGVFVFYVTNTVNGCESDFVKDSITINGCTVTAPSVDKTSQTVCATTALTAFTATGSNIKWYDATQTNQVATTASYTPTTTVTTDYYVSQTNVCEGPKTKVTVTINPLPTIIATTSSATICVGSTATLTASGGTSYTWDNALGLGTSKTVNPTLTTSYVVTNIASFGCTNTASITVTVVALPTVSINPASSAICNGNSQTITATGATNYWWSTNATTTSIIVNPTATQTYSVTGTTSGCSSTASTTVTVYPLTTTTITADKNPICINENVSLTASGSGTYNWSSGGTSATEILTPISTSNYTVTGTDANNCISTATIAITVNPLPTIITTITKPSVCLGNPTAITASGALNYNWSDGLGTNASVTATPTASTTYYVTGSNTLGCSNTASATITTLALPTAILTGGGSYCTTLPAVTANITGGKANYKVTYTTNGINPYPISGVTGTTNLPIAGDGDFELTQVIDANGCEAASYPAKVNVAKNGSATYTITGGATYCQGKTAADVAIDITSADGPWTLVYNDGTKDSTTSIAVGALPFLLKNPAKGIYTVKQITNKDNCVALGDATKSTTVGVNDTTIATITGVPANLCDNGQAIPLNYTPTIKTGETVAFSSITGGVTGNQYYPSQAGGAGAKTIKITFTNAAGCTSTNTSTVTILQSPVASIVGTPSMGVCFGIDQIIDASHTNTTAPYSFGWSLSNTKLTADNVEDPTFKAGAAIGTYPLEYVVTDANACKDTANIDIIVKNKTKPAWLTTLPALCSNGNSMDLSKYVTPYDANGSFTIDGNPTTNTLDPKVNTVTTHALRYTYAMGSCSDFADTTITISQTPNVSLGTYQTTFCDYDGVYTFSSLSPTTGGTLTGNGVTNGTTFTFDPKNATTKDASFDLDYSVTQNGCTDSKKVPVTVWSAPTVTFALPTTACAKDAGINLSTLVTPAGGTYNVADGLIGNYFYPKAVSGYGTPINIEYTANAHGCSTKMSKSITVSQTPVPTVTDASTIMPVTTVPDITAVGTNLKLYSATYSVIDANWNGSYANPANTTANVYPYFVTQTLNGCESDSVPVKLTVTNCTAKTPTGTSTSICLGDVAGTLTATGLTQVGMEYRWFDSKDKFTDTVGASIAMKSGLAVGKHIFFVKIYDPANTCYGAASQPVVYEVKALPTIQFAPDTVMCENNAIQDLSKKTVPNTATFWLGSTQIPNFNPMGKVGINQVEVRYTDISTNCSNSLKDTIRVKATPVLLFTTPATACSNGSIINFSATPIGGAYFGGPLNSDGKSVNPKNLALNIATTYSYKFTDAQGCSDTVSSSITTYDSTKVKIQVPGNKTNLCEKGTAITLGADITGGTFTVNGSANAGTFDPVNAGTYKVVYNYTNSNSCKSSDQITITVNALPTLLNTIASSDLTACSNGGLISLSGKPSGLVFTGTGVNSTVTGYTFNPKVAAIGLNKLYYSFTDKTTSCSNKDSITIDVQDIQPPVVVDQSFYTFNYPKVITATGTILKWYGNKGDKSDLIITAQQLTNTNLKAKPYADSLNQAGIFPFYVSQTSGKCESDVAKIMITVNDCSAKEPTLSSVTPSSCYGSAFTAITISKHNKGDETHWYDANKKYIGSGDSFTPSASNLANTKGPSFLYAADSLTSEGCKSNLVQIIYTVNFVDIPTITAPAPQCEKAIIGQVSATGNGGTFEWTLGTQTFTVNPLTLATAGIVKGQTSPYIFNTIQIKNGCKSASVSTNVIINPTPAKPTVSASYELCSGEALTDLEATASGTVIWYSDATLKTEVVKTMNIPFTKLNNADGTHVYYAVNFDGACTSDTSIATYTVKALPNTPQGKDAWKCSTISTIPMLSVSLSNSGTAKWYADKALTTVLHTGLQYQPANADVTYYVVAEKNGCSSKAYLPIKDTTFTAPMPTITIKKGDNDSICSGQQITLYATGKDVKWYDESNSFIQQSISLVHKWTEEGNYTYYASARSMAPDNITSCYSDKTTSTVLTDKPIPAKLTITPITACSNDTAKTFITGYNGTGTVVWHNDLGQTVAYTSNFRPNKSTLKTGDFNVFDATILENGCYGAMTKVIYMVQKTVPKPVIVQTPKPYCVGSSDPLQLSIANPLISFWLDSANNSTTTQSIINTIKNTGVYVVKAYQQFGLCYSDTVIDSIHAYKTPKPEIVGKDSVCENTMHEIYNISSKSQNITSIYDWTVTGNVVTYSPDKDSKYRLGIQWPTPEIDTIYVTETAKDGCIGRDTMIVRIAPTPTALFLDESESAEGTVFFYNKSEQESIHSGTHTEEVYNRYLWNFGHSNDVFELYPKSEGTDNNPIKQNYDYGYWKVSLLVTNDFGCQDTYSKEVFVNYSNGLFIPNSFIPESNVLGLRTFKPVGYNLKSYRLSIYDTWGNLIWYTDKLVDGSPSEGWDGNSMGVTLKMDTYIWKIDAEFINGKQWKGLEYKPGKFSKFGNLLLLR